MFLSIAKKIQYSLYSRTRRFLIFLLIASMILSMQPIIKQVHAEEGRSGTLHKEAQIHQSKNDKLKSYMPEQVIVKFKAGTQESKKSTLKTSLSLQSKRYFKKSRAELMNIYDGRSVEQVVAFLEASGQVEYAQPNYIYHVESQIPSDPYWNNLWGLQNIGQTINGSAGAANIDIDAPEAWDYTSNLKETVVAVIDTGIDISHPDLSGKIWINSGEIPGNGIDDEGNGYVDDVNGWNFYHSNSDSTVVGDNTVFNPIDGDEHGTHVSGIIAAAANTIGVVGVAPNVKIMPLKFIAYHDDLDTYPKVGIYGDTVDAINAIEYAADKGVKVCNASWGGQGGYDEDIALNDAIIASGMVFVAAAGNETLNIDTNPYTPAGLDADNIISVAAVNNIGNLASFSNYGVINVDVGAPGQDILSTIPDSAYAYISGTSMATPYVTGIAAVLLAQKNLTPQEVITLIKNSGKNLEALVNKTASGKMVNMYNAVATSVSQPSVALGSASASVASSYTISFNTGSYGKLVSNKTPEDIISITFPDGTGFPPAISLDKIKVNGVTVGTSGESIIPVGQTIKFKVPITIGHSTLTTVEIIKEAGIINPVTPASSYKLKVSTSADPLPVESTAYMTTVVPTWASGSMLTASSITETGLTLNWTSAEDDGGIVAYKVYQSDSLLGSVSDAVYSVSGLQPWTQYMFRVYAGDEEGNWSSALEFTTRTSDANAPIWSEGSTMTAENVTETTLTLNWTAAGDNVAVTGYKIYRGIELLDTVTGTVYSYNVNGLSQNTQYMFKVQAGDAFGNWTTNGPTVTVNTNSTSEQLPSDVPGGSVPSSAPAQEEQKTENIFEDIDSIAQKPQLSIEDAGKLAEVAKSLTDSLKDKSVTDSDKTTIIDKASGAIDHLVVAINKVSDQTAANNIVAKVIEVIEAITEASLSINDEVSVEKVLSSVTTLLNGSASLVTAVKDIKQQQLVIEKTIEVLKATSVVLDKVSAEKAVESAQNIIIGAAKVAVSDKNEIRAESVAKEITKIAEKVIEKLGKDIVVPVVDGKLAKVIITDADAGQILDKAEAVLATKKNLELRMQENNIKQKLGSKIVIDIPKQEGVTKIETTLPVGLMNSIKARGVEKIEVSTGVATVVISPDAIKAGEAHTVLLTVEQNDKSTLTEMQRSMSGNSPVYDFNMQLGKKDGTQEKISSFEKPIEVRVPYALAEGEDPEKITVFYLNDKGELENKSGKYDPVTKTVKFTTEHLSLYLIKQNNVGFNDVMQNSWAKKYIEVMASKGILMGMSSDMFKPNGDVTRAEFAAMLVRAFNVPEAKKMADSSIFSDITENGWYVKAVSAAVEAGLINGYEDKTFKPNAKISRQEMAVVAARAAKLFKGAVAPNDINELLSFKDAAGVKEYAKESAALAVKYGIINGKPGQKYEPNNYATRAETAKIIYMMYNMEE